MSESERPTFNNAEIIIGGPKNFVNSWLAGLPLYAGVALLGLLGLRNKASLILDSRTFSAWILSTWGCTKKSA